MTKQEQDKFWDLLSEESKSEYRAEYYNRLEDSKRDPVCPEGGGDLTVFRSQTIVEELENMFGKHNLQPSLTYEDVVRELFKNGAWQIDEEYLNSDEIIIPTFGFHCTSKKQVQKLEAINKLLNVAKFLNKNEDGSDWVPDFSDKSNEFYTLGIEPYVPTEIVYFRTEEIAQQTVKIIGEDVVRIALTTKY